MARGKAYINGKGKVRTYRPPNIPLDKSISQMAREKIGKPKDYKNMGDYRLALAKARAEIKEKYSNKGLIHKFIGEGTGHKTDYRKEYAQVARIVCSVYGSTAVELAKFFQVEVQTIHRWAKEHPEFDKALHDRSTEINMQVMGRLARRALGFYADTEKIFYDVKRGDVVRVPTKEYFPPSETAIFMWLKNRMPEYWKDMKDVNVDETRRITMEIYKNFDTMTPEQATDAYQELLKIEGTAPKKGSGTITDAPIIERDPGKDSV